MTKITLDSPRSSAADRDRFARERVGSASQQPTTSSEQKRREKELNDLLEERKATIAAMKIVERARNTIDELQKKLDSEEA